MHYGESIQTDPRLQNLVSREKFLLLVIMPRFRTLADMRKEWVRRTCKGSVLVPCLMVIVLHMGAIGLCVPDGSSICAGGPELDGADQDGWAKYAFSDYGPPIINALATLMLSFYANVCMSLYMEGYFAARQLQESIVDVMTMVAGTIPSHMREVRTEFWRCVNLHHLCSYVLADKQRLTYNLDNFLIPVASAYGEWDPGAGRFGMLRAEELELLSAWSSSFVKKLQVKAVSSPQAKVLVERAETRARTRRLPAKGAASGVSNPSTQGRPPAPKLTRMITQRLAGKKVDKERMELQMDKRRASSSNKLLAGQAGAPDTAMKTLANSRGDVSSDAAVMHAALGVRLYQLVDLVIEEKLSRAAWPAWNAALMKLRSNSERLKHRALFRLPRIYQASVRFLVASTILTDTYIIASHAARLLRNTHADEGWRQHAYLGAFIDLFLNLTLAWCLSVFLDAIADMQTPFGGEPLDMPGLSYVCGAAEISLRMVVGATAQPDGVGQEAPNRLFSVLNRPLDKAALMREQKKPEKEEGEEEEEEEEEEADADAGDN